MGLRYGQALYGGFTYGISPPGFSFRIEIRNSAGTLQQYAQNEIISLDWAFTDAGGCDAFKLVLKRNYDDFDELTTSTKKGIYDLRVYIVPDFAESAVLFYRGFFTHIRPLLQDANELVTINGHGYVHLLRKTQVHTAGAPVEYSSTDVDGVADDLADNYLPSAITKGTIDVFTTAVTSMKFNGSLYDAFSELAEIVNAEWGVDSSLNFYFRERSTVVGKRFTVGYDIEVLEDEIDYDQIVNSVIVEGGDVGGVPVRYTLTDAQSVTDYGYTFEMRIQNSAVLDSGVAEQLANTYLDKYKEFQRNMRVSLPRYNQKIEADNPMKLVAIDKNPKPSVWNYGTFLYGEQTYTADDKFRIRKIRYKLNDTSLNVDIEFNRGKPDIKNSLNQLNFRLEQQRQAAGV